MCVGAWNQAKKKCDHLLRTPLAASRDNYSLPTVLSGSYLAARRPWSLQLAKAVTLRVPNVFRADVTSVNWLLIRF